MTRLAAVLATLVLFFGAATSAHAALPPFELVQKSVAKARKAPLSLNLRVTQTGEKLTEWQLRGEFEFGDIPKQFRDNVPLAVQLLWIATLSADPIAEVQSRHGLVNEKIATVGVQEGFVYVYGSVPAVSVHRDLVRLAGFSVDVDGARWVARLSWAEHELTGVMITRNGGTVLTARRAP